MVDLSRVTTIVTVSECLRTKYDKLDDAGILNLVHMAKNETMKDPSRIDMAVEIAEERGLVTID